MRIIMEESGIVNVREGIYAGKRCTFTHIDPKTGNYYTPDVLTGTFNGEMVFGKWVDPESIAFC